MIAWLHAHALAAVVIALFVGGFGGILIMALLVSGRDPADVREAERRAGHW